MKDRDASRHPGPWRVMKVDSEFAGLLVAVGFLVMGFVSMPIATWFILGAVALGVFVALVLRFIPKKYSRVVVGMVVILVTVVLFWEGRNPPRRPPPTVSSNALYVLPDDVQVRLHNRGYWLDCWFDEQASVDRCKLTDEKGAGLFEDVFLPCIGKEPLHQSAFVVDGSRQWGGSNWKRFPDKGVTVPVVYVWDQVLLPRSFYAEAKRDVYCPPL